MQMAISALVEFNQGPRCKSKASSVQESSRLLKLQGTKAVALLMLGEVLNN